MAIIYYRDGVYSLIRVNIVSCVLPGFVFILFMNHFTALLTCFVLYPVLGMEIIGPKWRMETGIFVQGWFAGGMYWKR